MAPDWLAANPRARRDRPFGREQRHVVNPNGVAELARSLSECPAHSVTPLLALPALAKALGVGEIRVKDESKRFGFGAFKALGGVLAVGNELSRICGDAWHTHVDYARLMAGEGRELWGGTVFTTASSGNHGRSVAAGAKLFGTRCVVFLPSFTSAGKEAAIRARGAEVVRVDGDYDGAVAACRAAAAGNGWTIISDTSWEGYETAPRDVMRGYTVLVQEALEQWPEGPTHVFVQAGVGGLAAAVIGHMWAEMARRPTFVVVEPESADCWFQSNRAGAPAPASGDAATAMGGLACREISPLTWPVIGLAADWFMTIGEDLVVPTRRRLAAPLDGDPAVESGPSGAAGVAGLVRVCVDRAAYAAVGLDAGSRVLLINSEGAMGEAPPD